ncbi:hypothetical protein HMPREF0484_5103 [Klebsiella pneumoniae subsp. rhinoscleromatis ATCC 13884]|nr:hypothetical protein HMPREF0484_5103 [Klebsiella pneumoniae subsp. rhinoscleromatis ATCC 13884]
MKQRKPYTTYSATTKANLHSSPYITPADKIFTTNEPKQK